MARILYKAAKIIEVGGKRKVAHKVKKHYILDTSRDFHCDDGIITKGDLGKKSGSLVKTNKGVEFVVFDAQFNDDYDKISRAPQIIPRKDVGLIIAECGLNKDSVVLDAGSGSGGLCCFLAKICKEVVSYDIKDEHLEVVKKNKDKLGLKNLTVKKGDITEPISEKDFDCVVLDMGNPWDAVPTVDAALKVGGYLVSYSPTVPQVMDFVSDVGYNENFVLLKVSQVMESEWEVRGRKVRPKSGSIIHSGFLVFVRKIS
ncbi:MAG: tRNA (adenine-N1)-methyltransferase [Candidatus Nanoarchaeia archaeon]